MNDLRHDVAEAIRRVRAQVEWKPDKDVVHLRKRQAMGHLSANASLGDYNGLIAMLVHSPKARVLTYGFGQGHYVAVRDMVAGRDWLAIFTVTAVMETALPPDDIDTYLAQPGFTEIGTIEELLA